MTDLPDRRSEFEEQMRETARQTAIQQRGMLPEEAIPEIVTQSLVEMAVQAGWVADENDIPAKEREHPPLQRSGNEVELVHEQTTKHQGRCLNVEVGYDYATGNRTVRIGVTQSKYDWKKRDDRPGSVILVRRDTEPSEARDMENHVFEQIARVKDEIDMAEQACSTTTWDAIESALEWEAEVS